MVAYNHSVNQAIITTSKLETKNTRVIFLTVIRLCCSNEQNWRVSNWQIDTDTLIAIIKAQMQNYLLVFDDHIISNICNMPKLKINKLSTEINVVSKPPLEIMSPGLDNRNQYVCSNLLIAKIAKLPHWKNVYSLYGCPFK